MAGYTRQSLAQILNGEIVSAPPLNAEFNQILAAFNNSTGHKHDGTAAEGPPIDRIADSDQNNLIFVDTSANQINFYVESSAASVGQISIQDGAIVPFTDNDIDLGSSSFEFKDLYIDGTANIDTLAASLIVVEAGTAGAPSITTTGDTDNGLYFNAANQMSYTSGGVAQVTFKDGSIVPVTDNDIDLGEVGAEFKDLYIDGTANIDSLVADTADINAGTIDNTVIGATTPAAGTFTNLTVSTGSTIDFTGATVSNGGTFTTVTILGGTITGITDLAIADGGTGASTASAARTNLGVAIGTNVQAYDAGLQSISGLTTTADQMIYTTSSDTYATASLTSAGRALLDDADASAQRTTLGLGTLATQNANSVAITGGAIAGVTINASVIGGTTPAAATFTTLNATGGGSLTGTWSDLGTVTTIDLNGGTVDGTVVGGTTPAAGTFTTLNATGGGALTGTWSDLGTVTTMDLNGGTVDGTVVGGTTPAAGTFTTLNATGGGALTGTWSDLGTVTTMDLNGGTVDNVVIGGAVAAAGTFTTLNASGGGSLTGTWSDLGTVTTMDLNGGTVDGVVIGGTTAAAGTFSTLNATGGGALTGTWTDLGTVTTVDLNGGTIDGVVIGGASAGAGTFTTITATTSVTTPLVTNAGTLALSATGANVIALSTNGSERARITSGGTLAVGDVGGLNSELIHARASSGTISTLLNSGATGDVLRLYHENTAVTAFSIWGAGVQRGFISSPVSSNGLILGHGDTEAARIDSSGRFLLGTTSGSNLLTVAGTASISGALTASGGGALTGTWSDLGTVTTIDINGGTIDGVVIGGAAAAAATVTTLSAGGAAVYPGVITAIGAAGEVVAGNTTGSLATFSNAGAAAISLHGAAANSATVYFGTTGANGNTIGRLVYDFSANAMAFFTGNTERARIVGTDFLIGTTTAGASKLVVADDSIQINTAKTPASAAATGTTGEFAWDASYFYICTATNTWRRVAHATW
jgi:hypothetical protein